MVVNLVLRDVTEADLPILFEHQLDAEAIRMSAFPAREWEAFFAHWARVLADERVINKTILCDGEVAGYIVSFDHAGAREIGYWIGRDHWGRGIASRALSSFLACETARPLRAGVAKHNVASIRVLEKCGFRAIGKEEEFARSGDTPIQGLIFELS